MRGEGHPRERMGIRRIPGIGLLRARFDANTAASLLQCVMEAVNPPAIQNHQGILKGITEWEVRVDGLKAKHNEYISASMRIAICVGMLPKDYQDMCSQQASGIGKPIGSTYNEMRDKIMNIANQRVSMITPTPMDIDAVRGYGGEDGGEDWGWGPGPYGWEDSQFDQFGVQAVGKGKGKGNGSCHNCG